MKKNGGGSIVMYGSPHAWCGEKDRSIYACSKGALLTLTEHIAHHYAVDQIRCNFVTMGWVPTEGELTMRAAKNFGNSQNPICLWGVCRRSRIMFLAPFIC